MSITNGYTTVIKLKARLFNSNLEVQADNDDDSQFEDVIEAVSRAIDQLKNREFFATTATRYFTAFNAKRCKIDDLLSLTTLKTDDDADGVFETTWATTDYRLFPYNHTPYLEIETRPNGNYEFPLDGGAVQVVGSFGYSSSVPDAIAEACLLGCMRVWNRKDSIYGTSGSAELGTLQVAGSLKKDAELMMLLGTIPTRIV